MERELIKVKDGLYTKPLKENEKEEFGVIITDPILLDPEIDDEKLKRIEKYEIRNSNGRYNGTHKGQFILGLIFDSQEDMFRILIELRRAGYVKSKLHRIDPRVYFRKTYTIETLKDWDFTNLENQITVKVKEKELEEFKEDLLNLGQKLGYRFTWGLEDLFDGTECYTTYVKNNFIIY